MILYFTGTGNSRFAARRLAQRLGDQTVSLGQVFRNKQPLQFHSVSPFVVVCPIYAWRLPKPVEELLAQGEFSGSRQLYLVVTMGASYGGAGSYVQKILAKTGMEYRGMAGVVMPDNFLVSFSMPGEDQALSILRQALPRLDQIAQTIAAGDTLPPSSSKGGWLLSGLVNWGFSHFMMSSKAFTVSDACVGCGKCAAECPVGNITLTGGKVRFSNHCSFCLGCIHRCPVHAIDYKGKGKKHGYYLCPPEEKILSQAED